MSDEGLALTGERTLPGIDHERYWFARHVAAYRLAAAHCRGLAVLDAGCGEGYGTALLAGEAAEAIGVDLAPEVARHAAARYPQARFLTADLTALPLRDGACDAVVSLQVIEHLPDVAGTLAETARVLAHGGRLVCATPNRLTFTPGSDTPVNPFHVREFTAAELCAALDGRFRVEAVLGVRHGPRLTALEAEAGRGLTDLQLDGPPETWPRWLAETVASVEPNDFEISGEDIDASLDLVALAAGR